MFEKDKLYLFRFTDEIDENDDRQADILDWDTAENEIIRAAVNKIDSQQYIPIEWESDSNYGVRYDTGELYYVGNYHTDYVDISGYVSLRYLRLASTASQDVAMQGMAFYDANYVYISGVQGLLNHSDSNPVIDTVEVPYGAVYARFTYKVYKDFVLEGKTNAVIKTRQEVNEAKKWVDGKDLDGQDVPSTAPQFENNANY